MSEQTNNNKHHGTITHLVLDLLLTERRERDGEVRGEPREEIGLISKQQCRIGRHEGITTHLVAVEGGD
jgi:hypothetical protein